MAVVVLCEDNSEFAEHSTEKSDAKKWDKTCIDARYTECWGTPIFHSCKGIRACAQLLVKSTSQLTAAKNVQGIWQSYCYNAPVSYQADSNRANEEK